jgi:hypothetical protein
VKLPRVSAVIVLAVVTASAAPSARQQAPNSSPSSKDIIYACLQRNDRFRIVERNEVCRANEVRVSWNIEGIQGPVGPAGPIGPQGIPGQTGARGATGESGPQGATGAPGAVGPIGPIGLTGAQGDAGPQGVPGIAGPQGPIGPQGIAGNDGAAGAPGAIGPAGPQGIAGAAGVAGATGPAGPQGPAGVNGLNGADGVAGPEGPQGPAGATGATGAKGDTGLRGLQGTQGEPGPPGPAGMGGAPLDENTALIYAPNIRIDVPGFSGNWIPDGISRIGYEIDVREMTTGLDVEYRLYGPGQAHVPNLRILMPESQRTNAKNWFNEAAKGKNIRKDITVWILKTDLSPASWVTLYDCFPVSYDNENVLLEVNVGRVDIKDLHEFPQDGQATDIEYPIESTHLIKTLGSTGSANNYAVDVTGGSTRIELTETTIGSDKFYTNSPGHKTLDTLTMRFVSAHQMVTDWIADTVEGKPWKRNMEVSLRSGGPKRMFYDAFPIRITFLNPLLLLENGWAPAVIDVSFKPIRVEYVP